MCPALRFYGVDDKIAFSSPQCAPRAHRVAEFSMARTPLAVARGPLSV